jgi:hypothetical protein
MNIDLKKCLNDRDTLSCIRDAFRTIGENGYLTPAEFFQNISDLDLELLSELCELGHENEIALRQISILALALLSGSCVDINENSVYNCTNLTRSLILIERLSRAGMVIPEYDNWSVDAPDDSVLVRSI